MSTANEPFYSSIARIKWWRYRYMLGALLIINALVIHSFFFDPSASSLNPFHSTTPETSGIEVFPPPSNEEDTPSNHADPPKHGEPVKPAEKQDKPKEQPADDKKPPTHEVKPQKDQKPAETPQDGDKKEGELTDAEKLAKAPQPKVEEPPKKVDPPKPPLAVPSYAPVTYVPPPDSKAPFTLHDYDFNGEYVGWPLERVCREAKTMPGLVYVCDNNTGGIGNVRNFILTCVRYAIEAGATGLIMPRIQRRVENDLVNLFSGNFKPFSYFFDEQHFRTVIGKHCPQMKIYNTLEDIPHHKNLYQAREFGPKGLNAADGCDGRDANRFLDYFPERHVAWLKKHHQLPTETNPVSVRFGWAVFFEWPIYRDGAEFALTFGDILRLRPDVEELAAITIDHLVNLVKGTQGKPDRKKLDAPYLGVHLRTEGDALSFWPNFDTQALGYLEQAGTRGFKHAYLASGNVTEGHKFGDLAMKNLGMTVVSKTDLLKGDDLKRLNELSWDQQALVDYLVLLKSSHFTGCSFSSFSMNLVVKRHVMTEGIRSRKWKSPQDSYSTLIGRFDNWFGDWMFMLECLWP